MFKSLQHILSTSITKQSSSWQHYLMKEWKTIVGNLSEQMVLEKVYDDTLLIGVYEHQWLQELHLLSHVIIKEINKHLDKPYIKKLRFKHSEKKQKKNNSTPTQQPAPSTLIPLTSHEKKALNSIKDADLQSVLHTFLSRCKHNKKQKNYEK